LGSAAPEHVEGQTVPTGEMLVAVVEQLGGVAGATSPPASPE
jgi:hypothetical protein